MRGEIKTGCFFQKDNLGDRTLWVLQGAWIESKRPEKSSNLDLMSMASVSAQFFCAIFSDAKLSDSFSYVLEKYKSKVKRES